MNIELITLPVTSFEQNCRILFDNEANKALVVDPGGDASRIRSTLESRKVELEAVWLTHSHLDHCGGVAELIEDTDVPLIGHPGEEDYRSRVEDICKMYGLPAGEMKNCPEPTEYIQGGETLSFGGETFEVRFCPGHSPGHVIFYCANQSLLLAGDTLFAGSIGRTDLPGGNHQQLLDKIVEEIYSLPEDTRVLPGHGPETTVGEEKKSNPFVRGTL